MKKIVTLEYDLNSSIAKIQLKRSDKKNALNQKMLEDLNNILDEINEMEEVKVVILEGDRSAFSVGADIKEFSALKDSYHFFKFLMYIQKTALRIRESDKIFIAVLNGYTLGGGLELALNCDFRIAGKDTKIGMPEIKLGLLPGAGGIYDLVKVIGSDKTMELICLGEMLSAEEALKLNLVRNVVDEKDLDIEVYTFAKKLADKSIHALQTAKKLVEKAKYSNLETLDKRFEATSVAMLFETDEVSKSLLSFERR